MADDRRRISRAGTPAGGEAPDGSKNSDDILVLETFLPYRLYHLADLVSREFSTIYKDRLGLTRPEWRVLAGLGQHGAMTATTLGE